MISYYRVSRPSGCLRYLISDGRDSVFLRRVFRFDGFVLEEITNYRFSLER